MPEITTGSTDPLTQIVTQTITGALNGGSTPAQLPVTYVTQSKYFSPVFNAAIFDGPIRIYFAQFQESQALKLYFNLQQRFGDAKKQSRGIFRERGRNVFVMLYPAREIFDQSFGEEVFTGEEALGSGSGAEVGPQSKLPQIVQTRLNSDYVVGVSGPLEDETFERLCLNLDGIIRGPDLRAL